MLKYVTCKNHFLDGPCNWVSFEVSSKHAKEEVKRFNKYFNTLSKKQQKEWYGGKKATITFYKKCFRCGGSYRNFSQSTPNELPFGSTINPIINRKE